jgi:hypothetical protein
VNLDFRFDFVRSKRGNLWREWNGYRVVVFEKSNAPGKYSWLIASDDGGTTFSRFDYPDEDSAVEGFYRHVDADA